MGRLSGHVKSPLEKLEDYQPVFSEYRERYDRSMVYSAGRVVCGDPKLELSYRTVENHMNSLLEGYHSFLGGVAFEEATSGIVIPVTHVEEAQLAEVSDGRGHQ